jgi:protein involved in polysaccharide export with SLBB domain
MKLGLKHLLTIRSSFMAQFNLRKRVIFCLFVLFHSSISLGQSISPAMASSLLQGAANSNPLSSNPPSVGKIDQATICAISGKNSPECIDSLREPSRSIDKVKVDKFSDIEASKLLPNSPNAFQTFISQSTGKNLPLYGQNLFSLNNPYSSIEVSNVPTDYVLGPGDELQVKVYSPSIDVDQRFVINREGMIVLPKIGPISLAGTKVADLEGRLKNELSQTLTDFNLYVSMGQLRGIEVYVTGQARSPGKHNLSSVSTMINALFAIGGPSSNGSMRNIQLLRGGRLINTIDLYDFLSKGNRGMDMRLLPGDVINISPIGQQVALMGITPNPAIYELSPKRNNSLQEIIQLAGGLSALNSPSKATLERIENNSTNPLVAYSIDLRGEGMKMTLKDGDMITLLPINPSFANAVSLRILNTTLRLPLQGNAKIADLIPNKQALITPDYYYRRFNLRVVPNGQNQNQNQIPPPIDNQKKQANGYFGNQELINEQNAISNNDLARIRNNALSDQFNLENVMIERTLSKSLDPQIISINLNTAWADKNSDQNITLMPGDIISVYSQKDIQVPIERQSQIVRIQGEVNSPGIYQMRGGETLQQLIAKAGGLTDKAYVYGMLLSRESVRESQKKNIEIVVKRLESQVAIEGSQGITNLSASATDQQAQALLRSQNQARMREKINQLRTATPSGRVVLELDPKRTQLPDIVLEQGDEINIPSVPSVVSVIGAVYNENALIYKSERVVNDYLKVAGVTPNADLEATFIVRADGSLVAPNPDSSFFASSGKVDQKTLMPGDIVFVPEKIYKESGYSVFMRGLRDWTQVLYQFGLGAAGIKVLSQ